MTPPPLINHWACNPEQLPAECLNIVDIDIIQEAARRVNAKDTGRNAGKNAASC